MPSSNAAVVMATGPVNTALKKVIPKDFKFSDLFKNFRAPDAANFIFDNVTLTLSSNNIHFTGDLKMKGPLLAFKNYFATEDTMEVTAAFATTGTDLTKKIEPESFTIKAKNILYKEVFQGVILNKAVFQLDIKKSGSSWSLTPSFLGELDIIQLTDKDPGKLTFEVTKEASSLVVNAGASHLKGIFGMDSLTLDDLKVTGKLGSQKFLDIDAEFHAGAVTLHFAGQAIPDAVGFIASADKFNLDKLKAIFDQIFNSGLTMPDFDVSFKNTSVAFASHALTIGDEDVESGFTLRSEIKAHGHTITTSAEIASSGVKFSGALKDLKLGPVDLKKVGLDFQIYKKSVHKPTKFELTGEAVIEGLKVDCGVYFEKETSWTTVLYANLTADTFSMSSFIPAMKGTFPDELKFSKVGFIYASADCTTQNESLNYSVKKGLQLMGVLEEIPGLSSLTGNKQIGLVLSAHIGRTTNISIEIPDTRLDLGQHVHTDPFKIQINILPTPALVLVFGMNVDVPKQTIPLHFDMMLEIGAIEASGSVTMKNYWKDPFGVHGLKIGPALALELGINYAQFASTGTPSEFGVAGGLEIGDVVIQMAVKISENPTEEILSGKLAKLNAKQLIDFAADLMTVDIGEVPDFFTLKDLEIYCAPAGGTIGTIVYEPGFSFAGDLVLFGKEIAMYTRISDTGIEGAGHIDNIDFGPLKISGEKGKEAMIDLELTAEKQSLLIDGSFSFLGIREGIFVDISNKGLAFKFEQDFFGQLTFEIDGKSSGSLDKPASLDFELHGEMDNHITDYMKTELTGKINTALDTTNKTISAAQKDVDKAKKAYDALYKPAQKELTKAQADADALLTKLSKDVKNEKANYDKTIGAAQAELTKAEQAYNKAFNDATAEVTKAQKKYNNGINSAQKAVTKAERDYNNGIAAAQRNVDNAQRAYDNSIGSAQRSIDKASRDVDWCKKDHYHYGSTLAAYGVAKAALAAAKLFLEGVKKGGDYTAFASARAALQVAKTGAKYTAFQGAQTALRVAKTGVNYTAFEGAKATLNAIKTGSKYTAWQAAKGSLSTAKIVGQQAIDTASSALNNIGKSATYLALQAAKVALKGIENGTAAVAFNSAKAALAAAKAGSAAVLKLSAFIAQHAGDLIDIKKFSFSGSLKAIEKGNLFDADLTVAILGETNNWSVDFNVKDIASFIDSLFHKIWEEMKSIAA